MNRSLNNQIVNNKNLTNTPDRLFTFMRHISYTISIKFRFR